ncbi:hypothetical protein [Stetteria hydrogenophila]
MFGVNVERARAAGSRLAEALRGIEPDPFIDPRLYPRASADRETVVMYFLVMVAMDHRLSRPGRPYEGLVDGELYHGADLLYRLGAKKLEEDPDFFTAERLARVTERDVVEWLSAPKPRGGVARPPDPGVRAWLLRDIGVKLAKLYGGEAYRLVAESHGLLRGERGVEGFIDRLKVFRAYQDPVEKKPFLLAKFLERRGILEVRDPWNKEVPVDNHLARIAVRIGAVTLDDEAIEKIAAGVEFTWEEDVLIRTAARMAYKEAARAGGVDPFIMDDMLWLYGRSCCTRERPACIYGCTEECERIGGCRGGKALLEDLCLARADRRYLVNEHVYLNTWYY